MKSVTSENESRKLIAFLVLLMTILAVVLPSLSTAEVLVIVNPKLNITQLSTEDVKKVFLGKKMTWEDEKDTEIKFVLIPDEDCHDEFVKRYTQKTTGQFKRYWNNMLFTGKGQLPKNANSIKDMIQFVADTEGAIGYVAPGSPLEGVTVIDIID